MNWLPAIFSLMVAAAGWFYIMHASNARVLSSVEQDQDNQLRIRLRRFGGVAMIGLAVAFYAAFVLSDRGGNPLVIAVCLLAVLVLLPTVLFLAWVDLRLTRKMRESIKRREL